MRSQPGQGTTAEIWLPAAIAGTAHAKPDDAAAPASPEHARKLKVLAVDDDRLVLFNTVAMLEDMGHEVMEAGSGAEALELMGRQRFDLVITDQSMPRMSGTQLMEAIARDWPDMKVILATGYAELPGGVQVKTPRLNKPFTERDLARVLAEI
jgi:CheY-like chemotaxis protein